MTAPTATAERPAPPTRGTVDDGASRDSNGGGGAPARRAIVRWAWRLFRREWRQQILIVSLLTAAVAGSVGLATAGYNLAPVEGNADFGTANHFFEFPDPDPQSMPVKLDAAREWFGSIDPIGHTIVPVPGSPLVVDYRVQDPEGPFGGPMLALSSGRYPQQADEVAISPGVAELTGITVGESIALDGVERTVVGLVENPSRLSDDFVLLHPSLLTNAESVTMLVDASEARVVDFRIPGDRARIIASRGEIPEDVLAVILVLIISMVALFLVALVAAASFMVIAQRRLPQLGMLSAVGATAKHVRLTMIASGAVTGVVAAVAGATLGVVGWLVVAPQMENAVDHRIDPSNVPWWLVVVGMTLAVVTAIGAAWWPARTMARIPTVRALSGRPPPPTPVHRSAALALGLIIGGGICLTMGSDASSNDGVAPSTLLLIGGGGFAVFAGVLLAGPIAIRGLARCAARLPITSRLALRDLGRYQARSGAALAAISLVIGIPIAIVATIASAENSVGLGNLPSNQLLVHPADIGPFIPEAAALGGLQEGTDLMAASLGPDTVVVGYDVAVDPNAAADPKLGARPPIIVAEPIDDGWRDASALFVATDPALGLLGLSMDDLDPQTEIHTAETGPLGLLDNPPVLVDVPTERPERREVELLPVTGTLHGDYSAVPSTFITIDDLRERGWTTAPSGIWMIETADPLTSEELSTVRDIAASHGLVVESRDVEKGLTALRLGAMTAGMLIALAVVAMTVGLIRSEATGDLRTLTAAGATSSTRRKLSAVTTGALAALGVVLGATGAYLALAAGGIANLLPLPYGDLAIIALGTPLCAAAAGWLLAGREPAAIARRPIA